jgi:TonB-dependent receptor
MASETPDTIVVTGRRSESVSRQQEKDSINLINIQPAEALAKYPDFNAAESLARVSGVSLSTDTGEGRFVNIRGIDGNLNGTTFGGVQLLNTQPGGTYFGSGGRAVELDTIPIGSIDQLIVRKTGRPDQEAEGLGGSVDIVPRTAQGIKKPFIEGTLGYGYQPAHNHYGVYRAILAAGTRFGADKAWGIELNGSYHEDHRGFDDVEPAFTDASAPARNNRVLDSVDLRRDNYNRRRFGFGVELRYDPNPQSHYYFRADNAGYTEHVFRYLFNYNNLGVDAAGNDLPIGLARYTAPTAGANISSRDEEETHLNFVTALGGHNEFERFTIDYQGSYTAATYHRYYDYNARFTTPNNSFPVSYGFLPNIGLPTLTPSGFNPADPTQFTLSRYQNTTERAHDREWAGRVDITVPVALLGTDETIQFGGKVRLRDKIDTNQRSNFANVRGIPLTQVQGGGPYTGIYRGLYNIGYAPNIYALRRLIVQNPSSYPVSLGTPNVFFNDTENIYAGYLQYSGKVGKFGFLAGFRVENTDGTYRSPDLRDGRTVLAGRSNYTKFFPTVQLRYDFTPKLVARATYSTGIGRPGFNQLQNGNNPDFGNGTVSVGRPALQPTTADNFDVQVQWFLPRSGILSVGAFDKEFDNYIITTLNTVTGAQANTLFGYAAPNAFGPTDQVRVSGFGNVKNSYARGLEGSYDQKFTFLPGFLSGFGVYGNVTYVDSSIGLHPGSKSRLPGTSVLTWNLAGYYEAHGVQIRLAAQYVSPSIFGVGGAQGLDVYQDTKTQVDLTTTYEVRKGLQVYFQARNLTDAPLRYYEGFQNRPIQREFYDVSYEGGVRFAF